MVLVSLTVAKEGGLSISKGESLPQLFHVGVFVAVLMSVAL